MNRKQSISANVTWAVGGPAAVGLCLGSREGAAPALAAAVAFPIILLGVAALTAPALYIGAAVAGVAPAAQRMAGAIGRGLRDAGVVLAGLSPALLLLTSTAGSAQTVALLGPATLGLATVLAFRMLYGRLFGEAAGRWRSLGLFAAWTLVCVGIGADLLSSVLTGGAA